MSDGKQKSYWRAELLASLDQLSSLRDELRETEDGLLSDLIMEVDESLSRTRRAADALGQFYPALDGKAVRESGTRGFDPLTIATTIGVTTVVLPFVQSLIENAGNDAYRSLTRLIKRRRADEASTSPDPRTIVLCDRATNVRIAVDEHVDLTALTELREIDLSDVSLRNATLRWNPRTKKWEPDHDPSPVKLWLPGDPLE